MSSHEAVENERQQDPQRIQSEHDCEFYFLLINALTKCFCFRKFGYSEDTPFEVINKGTLQKFLLF